MDLRQEDGKERHEMRPSSQGVAFATVNTEPHWIPAHTDSQLSIRDGGGAHETTSLLEEPMTINV